MTTFKYCKKQGHVEVYLAGVFILSADTMEEAEYETEHLSVQETADLLLASITERRRA